MLDDARFYRDLGFSELPLCGKLPAIAQWKHLTQRYPTDEELAGWFSGTRRNIGIICGRISRIAVLDADSARMAEQLLEKLPKTPMMTKTAKGLHLFYRLEKGQHVPPRVRVNQMLLDVRGDMTFGSIVARETANGGDVEEVYRAFYLGLSCELVRAA